jgi:hypothetical protein
MTVIGKVQGGVVVFPPGTELPEGANVSVELLQQGAEESEKLDATDSFLQLIGDIAKPRPHWPKDYALNHGYYVAGEPKKS